MPVAFWIALGVLVVAAVAGAVHVFVRARAFMRVFKRFSADADEAMRRLNRRLDQLSLESESLEAHQARVQASISQLKVSVARLNVLRAAVDEVRESVSRVTALYPSK